MQLRIFARAIRASRPTVLFWTLICFPLLDELVSGLPVVAMPLLRDDLALSYTQVGLIFTVGQIVGLVFDPLMNLMSDRANKRWLVLLGMLGSALGYGLIAVAPHFAALLIAFSLISIAGTTSLDMAQATLIDGDLAAAARTMTRWTIAGGIGDLMTPLLIAGALGLGFGWRPLFWVAVLLWLGMATVVWPQRFPEASHAHDESDQPAPGPLASLREGLANPRLLRWAGITTVTSMLDEIFLGFAALYLTDVVGLQVAVASLLLGGQTIGGLIGLFALDRVLGRIRRERLLLGASLITLTSAVVLLTVRWLPATALALFAIGVSASCWYPLAAAAAYETLPGRSGTVRAVKSLGAPFEIVLPLVVGAVAQRWSVTAGLGVLCLAPVFVLLLLPKGD